MTSCQTIQNNPGPIVNLGTQGIAFTAAIAVLELAISPNDRVEKAKWIYSAANGLYTLMDGKVHTPEEVQAVLNQWTPDKTWWSELIKKAVNVYAGLYPSLKDEPKLAADALNALAAGLSSAAQIYIK